MTNLARRARPALATVLTTCLALLAGCDQPGGRSKGTQAKAVEFPDDQLKPAPEPQAPAQPAPAPVQPRPILGKRTQDIRDVEAEKKAGGQVVQPRITAKDPITLQGNAYVSIIGQAATLSIKQAVDLYQATNGEYPKTKDEFMSQVIKANNIALPTLPYYQEYGYDVPTHSLVIIEYPDRKQ
jgi:hypothetical protein